MDWSTHSKKGNEITDLTAKKGHQLESNRTKTMYGRKLMLRKMIEKWSKKWQGKVDGIKTGSCTRLIHHDLSKIQRLYITEWRLQILFNRFYMLWRLKLIFTKIQHGRSPHCSTCNTPEQLITCYYTVKNILTEGLTLSNTVDTIRR